LFIFLSEDVRKNTQKKAYISTTQFQEALELALPALNVLWMHLMKVITLLLLLLLLFVRRLNCFVLILTLIYIWMQIMDLIFFSILSKKERQNG
jgi:hypothetical protein